MSIESIMKTNNIVSFNAMVGNTAGIVTFKRESTHIPEFNFDDSIPNDHAYVDHYGNQGGFINAKLVVVKNGEMNAKNFNSLEDALMALVETNL